MRLFGIMDTGELRILRFASFGKTEPRTPHGSADEFHLNVLATVPQIRWQRHSFALPSSRSLEVIRPRA